MRRLLGASSAPAASASSGAPAGLHNDADVAFLTMMISHHAQAIAMSDIVGAREDLEAPIHAIADEVTADQAPEQDQMRDWLTGWGETEAPTGGMDHSDGMDHSSMMPVLTLEEMQELRDGGAKKAARLYLAYMVDHRESGIDTASTEIAEGINPAVVALAEEMVRVQSEQLVRLQDLLTG